MVFWAENTSNFQISVTDSSNIEVCLDFTENYEPVVSYLMFRIAMLEMLRQNFFIEQASYKLIRVIFQNISICNHIHEMNSTLTEYS